MSADGTLLLVDDERNVLRSLKRLLIDSDYKVLTAESGEEGLKAFDKNTIQLVVSDYRMPGMDGVEFLNKVREKSPDTIRIILSGYADAGAMMEAINEGQVYKFIPKPWDDQNLITTIKDSFERYKLQKENTELYAEISKKYRELQELTKTLEDKVAERTSDLEMKNKALTVAHNILDYLPVGVIGIDSTGVVVYMNKALKSFINVEQLFLGVPAGDIVDDRILDAMMTSMEDQKLRCVILDKDGKQGVICSPLPERRGVIGLYAWFDTEKYGREDLHSSEELGNVDVRQI